MRPFMYMGEGGKGGRGKGGNRQIFDVVRVEYRGLRTVGEYRKVLKMLKI